MTDENTPTVESLEFFMDQIGCARCHGDGHEQLLFRKFQHAFEPDGVEEAYTHWAICPKLREPILLAFFEESDTKVPDVD